MWQKLRGLLQSSMGIYTAIFVAIYLYGWTINALKNTHFDLAQLIEVYKWLLANHGINSGLNTSIPVVDQLKGGKKT